MVTLENEIISIKINPVGAELNSIFSKKSNTEFMWQAGREWPKHSPVLFPVVGELKNGKYNYNGNEYTLSRHGFARNEPFSLVEDGPGRLIFRLCENENTLQNYPFRFILEISYALQDNSVHITYCVQNPDKDDIYFSIGAHPAFKVPLKENENYTDYFLEFSRDENAERWLLDKGLLVKSEKFLNGRTLPLSKELFHSDALVFKGLKSDKIFLKNKCNDHSLEFNTGNAPYFGIWAAKDADFICLEPWWGIADSVNSSGKLGIKEGINKLEGECFFSAEWSVAVN